ncbi:MAG: GNAT family N-acetyltransferase [Anaerolineae bacterium]|nr:GNAT family N-acetyltransferase [Anaerolineae bacterium]
MKVRLATKADAEAIKNLMIKVFRDDPLMIWFLLQDRRQDAASEAFYDFMVKDYCLPDGLCWVTEDVSGAALWMPPGQWELPPIKQLSMIGVIVRSFGWQKLMLKFRERQKIDSCHPKEPHYYLSGLGVSEELRGQGMGSALIKPMLDRSDQEGVGCYLETSLERNLNFYQRHGFAVTQQLSIGPDELPVWLMWRDPRSS